MFEEKTHSSSLKRSMVTVAALLCIGAVGLWFSSFFVLPNEGGKGTAEESTLETSDLTGELVLTLIAKDRAAQDIPGVPQGYIYNVQRDSLERIDNGTLFSLQHTYSSNGIYAAFLGLANDSQQDLSAPGSINAHVFLASNTEQGGNNVIRLSTEESFAKAVPVVSNTGEVLYSSLPQGNPSAIDPRFSNVTRADWWEIRHIAQNGDERILTHGTYPHWVNDTTFVYLRDDGMYQYDTDSNEEHVLIPLRAGVLSSSSMIDVSDDGSLIAWSIADQGKLYVFEAGNWERSEGAEVRTRGVIENTYGFWPVISPNGRYIALQTVSTVYEDTLTNPQPKIEFFSTHTLQPLSKQIDLDSFEQLQMFVTDWKRL